MRRIQSRWRTITAIAVCSTLAMVAPAPASAVPADMTAAIGQVEPAVARIDTTINYQHAIGAGTGVVLDPGGVVLTNFHVVQGADRITASVAGRSFPADLVGYDRVHDVAVIQLRGVSGLPVADADGKLIGRHRSTGIGRPRPARWSVSGAPSPPRTS